MLIVVYGTRTGYCGFVVHDNEKEIFLQENEGVTTGLDLLEAEWRDYPERLRAILSESKDFLSQGNLQIVSFGVTYRRRHDQDFLEGDGARGIFNSNRDAWKKYIGH
jgi:hypothetical protein